MAADGTDGYRDVEPAAWYYEAVDWARVNGIIGGDGNVFDPQGEITRAETASMLYHWRADSEEKNVTVNENDGILIAYFSHTGNTKAWPVILPELPAETFLRSCHLSPIRRTMTP